MVKLTEAQRRGLIECCAMGDGSFYSRHLSGTKQERATSNLHSLRKLGYLEAVKEGPNGQSQYRWRVTPAGRAALADGGRDAG